MTADDLRKMLERQRMDDIDTAMEVDLPEQGSVTLNNDLLWRTVTEYLEHRKALTRSNASLGGITSSEIRACWQMSREKGNPTRLSLSRSGFTLCKPDCFLRFTKSSAIRQTEHRR